MIKPHYHLAALAGWYLMLCPKGPVADVMPSYGCHTQRSFDAAKECEDARAIATQPPQPATVEKKQNARSEFRCVATDDRSSKVELGLGVRQQE